MFSNFTFITTAVKGVSNGMAVLKPLYWLFGRCMEGLLFVFDNKYFLSLIVFTILTRVILFPFNINQQRKMAKTTRLQPKIQKIQKKYANVTDPKERQKMQEEMNDLYAREGHNPMNMGCGTSIFQMVFLMGIIGIIYYPIQYILNVDIASKANEIAELLNINGAYFQIELLQNFGDYKATLMENFPTLFTEAKVNAIEAYRSNMMLFGLDMTQVPHWKDGIIVIIPILCLVTSLGSTIISTKIQKKNNPAAAQQQSQMMIMLLMMPFFSFYIAFKVSAAVGFYWIISNLVAIVQQLIMAKFFPPKRNMAREMVENTVQRRAREESIKNINRD